jgi:hypothetical protein
MSVSVKKQNKTYFLVPVSFIWTVQPSSTSLLEVALVLLLAIGVSLAQCLGFAVGAGGLQPWPL